MESLNPTLFLLLHVKSSLEVGDSVVVALEKSLFCMKIDQKKQVLKFLQLLSAEELQLIAFVHSIESLYARQLYSLLVQSYQGIPVLNSLKELENELKLAVEDELELFIQTLPFKLLLPIFLIMFPAFLLLLLGPILQNIFYGG